MDTQSKYLILYDGKGKELERIKIPKFFNGEIEYKWCVRMWKTKRSEDKKISHWDAKYLKSGID